MENNAFNQLVSWAQSQIGHYVMTGYVLKEVAQNKPDEVSVILAEYHEKEPIAEVIISANDALYKAQFSLLAGKEGPAPQRETLESSSIDELLEWLKTGNDSSDPSY